MVEETLQKQLRRAMLTALLVIVGLLAVGGLLSAYLYKSRKDALRSQVIAEAEEYRSRICKQLETDFQTLSTLSSFLDGDSTSDKTFLAKRLNNSLQSNSFLTMAYFDLDGNGVLVTVGQEAETEAKLSDLSPEGRGAVEIAMQGEAAVSKMFESEISGSRVFVYSVPVYADGEVIGALAASDHIEIFSDILSGNTVFGGGGYIHLLGQEGNFLAKSSKTVVRERTQSIFDGPYLSESARNEVKEAMERQERISASFDYEGKSYPFLIEPVGLNGWYLFCVNTGEGLGANSNAVAWVTQIVFIGILLMILFLMLYGYRLLHKYNENLIKLAYYDSQIEAENLYRFRQRLEKALADGGGAVVELCIRQYSFLTEIFGQEKTIHLLRQIREVADRRKRPDEFFCYHTEDRFYFFLRDTDEDTIRRRLEAFLQEISRVADIGQTDYQLAFYCGVAISRDGGDPERTMEILMTHVQFALERAKGAHTNFIWFFDSELHKKEELENYIESHMHQALQDGEFKMYLQPKKNLHTGKLEGAEALVRWKPDDGRVLFPDQFIPLFERNGFCVELDLYMVEQACRLLRSWMEHGMAPVSISVNQSKLLFFEPDYVQDLTAMLDRYNVPAQYIVLEILEGLALENVDELNEKIGQLQAKGFRVSLDDFGSGYSSMNTLGRLKINELKLDKEFLLNVSGQELERNCMIMEQIIHMARQLGIFTVAEGVETEEDEQFIRSVGCDVGQGYFYSRPISVEEFNETYMCKADKQVLEAASIPE